MGNNGTIAKNTAFLYVRMFIVLAVSLYTSRVVLHALDVVDYGVYNVVAGFVSLFSFLESSLSSSIQRFYNYEATKKGPDGFRQVFSEGLIIQAILSVILLILLETGGLWYVNHVMVVPPDRMIATHWIFQFSILSLLLVMFQVPFYGAIIAKERLGFYAVIQIVEVFLKLGIAILIASYSSDRLILYGGLMMGVTLCSTLMIVAFCLSQFKEARFFRQRDPGLMRSILSFSGWNLAGTLAFLLKGQGVNMLLNFFFGNIINAARGLAYQISGAVFGFSSNIITAFRPQLVNAYAEDDLDRTRSLMFSESKLCFALILLIITPLILEMDAVLHLWLGDIVPAYTGVFASLVLVDTLICTLNAPCTQVVFATGKIRRYQIGTTLTNLCLLPVCWALLKGGCPPASVFVATIAFSCILQVLSLFLTRQVFPFAWKDYFREVLGRCLGITLLLPILPLALRMLLPDSIGRLILVCIATVLSALPLLYWVVLNPGERSGLRNALRRMIPSQSR